MVPYSRKGITRAEPCSCALPVFSVSFLSTLPEVGMHDRETLSPSTVIHSPKSRMKGFRHMFLIPPSFLASDLVSFGYEYTIASTDHTADLSETQLGDLGRSGPFLRAHCCDVDCCPLAVRNAIGNAIGSGGEQA